MAEQVGETTRELELLIRRWGEGDESVRESIVARACERLRLLAHRRLRDFKKARVRGFDTEDVAQEASLRLMHK